MTPLKALDLTSKFSESLATTMTEAENFGLFALTTQPHSLKRLTAS